MSITMDPITHRQNETDMDNARKRTSVHVEKLTWFLYNGRDKWLQKHKIEQVLSKDPIFDKTRRPFETRTERFNSGARITNRIFELQESLGWTEEETSIAEFIIGEPLPISLHNTAFSPVLLTLSSRSLLSSNSLSLLTKHHGIHGAYLQTELGHGTNVSSLETTATYLPSTKEFDLHSPTLSSTKWWVGALGKTATHGVVQAKLILPGGRDMGPHLFLVQLRSLEDHKLLPGITTGDVGPKAFGGYAPTDNGFARFNHVRIPKRQMLSKFADVTDEGKYVKPPHAKLNYSGMVYIRAGLVSNCAWLMAKAATISIRYATVRRQGTKGPDGLEVPIINYPSVYVRLLPILSRAYVFLELARNMTTSYNAMSNRLSSGDTSLVAELHATTSGLKILGTTHCIQDLETARRSMGGHGYSAFSGLANLYADYVPSVTFEGENYVLDQQTVRAALKAFRDITSGNTPLSSLQPSNHYLRLLVSEQIPPIINPISLTTDPATLILLLEWRAAALVKDLASMLKRNSAATGSDGSTPQSVEDATVYQRVSKAVTEAFIAGQLGKMLQDLDLESNPKGRRLKEDQKLGEKELRMIKKLYTLYLLSTIESSLADFLAFDLLRMSDADNSTSDAVFILRRTIAEICSELLPEAIGLTDAFGFSDWELNSALGRYDGRVYQTLWEKAQMEPLNQKEVPDAYEESIKPMLLRGRRQAMSVARGAKL
ncbi:peroxisomal oxidase [Dendrothele bispora CBS 962.96]|uniref:Acyl-coenzyme A oxidase n=1 Tax=Dendrothele bispora (strain CBS 962.96) TaxID=1314807 RepID=A0A4S8LKD9_DENBC|nr:peroxisomal oxidase [Dendrothele bispora CBS 962.96]